MAHPQWILSKAPEQCVASERYVFERLNEVLSEGWIILWGYVFMDNGQQREGDFLLLGPEGGVIVLEAKSKGSVLGYADRLAGVAARGHCDNPEIQVRAQWAAIRRELEGVADELHRKSSDFAPMPWVASLLCIHDATRQEIDRCAPHLAGLNSIMGRDDLEIFLSFYKQWADTYSPYHTKASRKVFLESRFGQIGAARTIRYLCDFISHDLDRLCDASFGMMDALQENPRFLINGASGSGKTWLLLNQALRWAKEPDASVLLLCYNQSLASYFSQLLSGLMRRGKDGDAPSRIRVHTWESLMQELCLQFELGWDDIDPSQEAKRKEYYRNTLPKVLAWLAKDETVHASYSALV